MHAALTLVGVLAALACGAAPDPGRTITLAATTTVEDSGLLAALVDEFVGLHPEYRVRAVTGGTGEMLELGRRGDVDLVLSHDPAAESAFVAAGHGSVRRVVMQNDFVIAGPASDPAGVRDLRDAAAALQRIAAAGAPFVSRGDDSGTHRKERSLWPLAGLRPNPGADWYTEAGVGMGDALRIADARGAYILTDRATYLVLGHTLKLVVHVEGDPILLNRYGVVRVSRAANGAGGSAFVDWITSEAGQQTIAGFGRRRFGRPLFRPAATVTTDSAMPGPAER